MGERRDIGPACLHPMRLNRGPQAWEIASGYHLEPLVPQESGYRVLQQQKMNTGLLISTLQSYCEE